LLVISINVCILICLTFKAMPNEDTLRSALLETNLHDLHAFASEIDEADIYSLTKDTLKIWSFKLHTIGEMLGKYVPSEIACSEQVPEALRGRSPSTRVPASKRRESSVVPHNDIGDHRAPATISMHAASAVHLLLDSLCHTAHAEWSVCYIYVESLKKLVLVGGAGKRLSCPGDVALHGNSGIEGLVLENGIGVNMALATSEKDYSDEQDQSFRDHTRSMLVFPLFKPGSSTSVIGVLEVGNRTRDGPFTEDDERTLSDCSRFIADIVSRYPNDITNPKTLDKSVFVRTRDPTHSKSVPAARQPLMVYRTHRHTQPRKSEVSRDAVTLPRGASVEDVVDHVSRVSEAWRSAVLLNVELEHEIRRLHEALRVSRRETARLQEQTNVR
jgi:GAF domain-containing protein